MTGFLFSLMSLFKKNPDVETAHALYADTILAARRTELFTEMGVPDTPEGRFEMLALMAFLVLRRLKSDDAARDVAQAYFDVMFEDIDSNLRELGVGDISVGKKVKRLAESFYGRIKAYEEALAAGNNGELCRTLARHPYRNTEPAEHNLERLARQIRAEDAHLAAQSMSALLDGKISFCTIQPA